MTYPTESDDHVMDQSTNTKFNNMKTNDDVSSGALLRAADYECGGGKIENSITVTSDRNHHLGLM